MPVPHTLLSLLEREKLHGYELRRRLSEEFGPQWSLDYGQLYRALGVLRRMGWARVRMAPGRSGPPRKVYAITRAGREELGRWKQEPGPEARSARDDLAVRLRVDLSSGAGTDAIIAVRRRALDERQKAERAISDEARSARNATRWLAAETQRRRTDATLAALAAWEAVFGGARPEPPKQEESLVAMGSDDPLLDLLSRSLAERHPELRFHASAVGSLGGLLALREGRAHVAGIHLLDPDTGEYNVGFVRHLLPEEPTVLVNLSLREQGLMVARGNPKRIRRLGDLARPEVRFINRQPGAGTRLLLHQRLRRAGVDPHSLAGYDTEAPTHDAVAASITAAAADAGPGLRAVAEAWGLDFLPIGYERYDLAVPRKVFDSPRFRPVLRMVRQSSFRKQAARLPGYDLSQMSDIVADLR